MQRHELDLVSLIAGLLAGTGAILYLLDLDGAIEVDARWLASLAFIGLGLVALATAVRAARTRG